MEPTHPLFQSPRNVELTFTEMRTPGEYPFYALKAPPPTMRVWRVQEKDYPDIDPGLASDLYGFDDSPDAEVIARGISGKGPETVSIGRQGNYLMWGYSAQPSEMTEEGRSVFVNAVVYMKQFDGRKPLVRREKSSRLWALRTAAFPRMLSDEYARAESQRLRDAFREHPDWLPVEYKGKQEEYLAEHIESLRKAYRDVLDRSFPPELRERFGEDAEKYIQYYSENLEYLYPADSSFSVDEDVKSLEISNRDVALLERCVKMLETNDRSALAQRLLERYTKEKFTEASQWRAWLTKNRGRLYFSDVGGFTFFVAP